MIESIMHPRVVLNGVGPDSAVMGRIHMRWSARPHLYPASRIHLGHAHVVEHLTILTMGTISVQRSDRKHPNVYTAPGFPRTLKIHMPATVWHQITALTEAYWECLFFDARPPGETAPFDAERG